MGKTGLFHFLNVFERDLALDIAMTVATVTALSNKADFTQE